MLTFPIIIYEITMSNKLKIIAAWIDSIILSLIYLTVGIMKLIGTEMDIKNFKDWGYPVWFRFPIGLIEMILGIGIFIPKYRLLTIYGVFIWTIAAVVTHIQAGQAELILYPMLFSLAAAIILLLSKDSLVKNTDKINLLS